MPDLINDYHARVAQLKRQFPDADEAAIEDFVCAVIDLEMRIESFDLLAERGSWERETGLLAAVWRWVRQLMW